MGTAGGDLLSYADDAEYDRETASLVLKAAEHVRKCLSRVDELKAESKQARELLKEAEAGLLELIATRAAERGKPSLLDGMDDEGVSGDEGEDSGRGDSFEEPAAGYRINPATPFGGPEVSE